MTYQEAIKVVFEMWRWELHSQRKNFPSDKAWEDAISEWRPDEIVHAKYGEEISPAAFNLFPHYGVTVHTGLNGRPSVITGKPIVFSFTDLKKKKVGDTVRLSNQCIPMVRAVLDQIDPSTAPGELFMKFEGDPIND